MADIHRDVLRESIVYLEKNLFTETVENHLFRDGILSGDDLRILDHEITTASRLKKFVLVLQQKPSSFPCLVNALKETNQTYVAEYLQNKEAEKLRLLREEICKWLERRVEPVAEGGQLLTELHQFIETHCDIKLLITLQDTLEFTRTILRNVNGNNYEDSSCNTTDLNGLTVPLKVRSDNPEYGPESRSMESWTVNDVCTWLRGIGQTSSVDKFKSEDIDGYALLTLDKKDLQRIKGLTVGAINNILGRRDDFNSKKSAGTEQGNTTEEQNASGLETLNSSVESWTVDKVCTWLDDIGQTPNVDKFRNQDIDGYALLKLEPKDLDKMDLTVGATMNNDLETKKPADTEQGKEQPVDASVDTSTRAEQEAAKTPGDREDRDKNSASSSPTVDEFRATSDDLTDPVRKEPVANLPPAEYPSQFKASTTEGLLKFLMDKIRDG